MDKVKCPVCGCEDPDKVIKNHATGAYTCINNNCWTYFMPPYIKMTEAEKIAQSELIARTMRFK